MANYEGYSLGYDNLSVGIIHFALDDYISTIKSLGRYYNKLNKYLESTEKAKTRYQRVGDICSYIYERIYNLEEIDKFMKSEWARSLTTLDIDSLYKKAKQELRKKGYRVGLMGLIVQTDEKGVKIFAKEIEGQYGKYTKYSLGINGKGKDGAWVNGYIDCKFKKGVSVPNKTQIKIKSAFFTPSKSGDKVYNHLMITDFSVLEEGESVSKDADEFVKIPDTEDDTPFL